MRGESEFGEKMRKFAWLDTILPFPPNTDSFGRQSAPELLCRSKTSHCVGANQWRYTGRPAPWKAAIDIHWDRKVSEQPCRPGESLIRALHKPKYRRAHTGCYFFDLQRHQQLSSLYHMSYPAMNLEEIWNYEKALKRIDGCQSDEDTSLDLSGLQLTRLPAEIGKLTALKSLYLSKNQLTSLPAEIGKLTALTTLSIAANHLTVLPPQIG